AASLVLGFTGAPLTDLLAGYTDAFPEGVHHAELALWHGLGLPLLFSVVAIGGGLLMFWKRDGVARTQGALSFGFHTERGYARSMRGRDRLAVEVSGRVQQGSVAAYLAIILVGVLVLTAGVELANLDLPVRAVLWDQPGQAVVALVTIAAALMAA